MDLFGKKRIQELQYSMKLQKSKADERIAQQEEIIKAQATVIKMLCADLKNYKEDTIGENQQLKEKLRRALSMQNSLKEYAENLEGKLKEAS